MQINIKTSGENQAIVTQLTKKLTGGTKENVIAKNTKTIFCLMDSIEISILP